MEVDIVFSWVDGEDSRHKQARARYLRQSDHHYSSTASCRWDSTRNEFKHAIDSCLAFAPWIRRIFVVVSFSQRPLFCGVEPYKSRVTVVDDSELFVPFQRHLPVFNSHSIEAHLAKIPDLAEHFLYSCDDEMFGSRVTPLDFFTKEGTPLFFKGNPYPDKDLKHKSSLPSWYNARSNNSLILDGLFGPKKRYDCAHQVRPCLKSVLLDMWNIPEISKKLELTSSHRFRHHEDIEPIGLACNIALEVHGGLVMSPSALYMSVTSSTTPFELTLWFCKLLSQKPKMFCLNDARETFENPKVCKIWKHCLDHFLPHQTFTVNLS